MGFEEKRRTPRVTLSCKVKAETNRGTFTGQGRDLSEGGMGVYLKKLPTVDSTVTVRFELPRGENPIEATADVRYLHREGPGVHDDWMGIKFTRMATACQKTIKAYVRENYDASKPHVPGLPPLAKP
ncbi:MAG: PilZ domain-containing protein [Deltaproteobacteria bacterium]|nr:PilZ domain-containing protein [Deltaproteobacteria bacterium]